MSTLEDSLNAVDLNDVPRDSLFQITKPVFQGAVPVCLPGDYFMVRGPDRLSAEFRAIQEAVKSVAPNVAYALLQTRGDIFTVIPFAENIHDGSGVCFGAGNLGRLRPGSKDNIKLSPITGERVPVSTQRASKLPKNRPLFLAKDYHRVSSRGSSQAGIELYKLPPGVEPDGSHSWNPMLSGIYIFKGDQVELREKEGQVFCLTGGSGNRREDALIADFELEAFVPEEHVAYQRGMVSADMN